MAAGRDGPGWLGLGWVGSGVIGGAAAGVVLGAAFVPAVAVVLGMVADPSASWPAPLPVVVVPAVVAGAAGVGLALLMQRSATRLGAWPS